MLPRYSYLGLIAIAVVAASVGGYVYASSVLFPGQRISPPMSVIHIPKGSSIPPPNWVDFTNLSSPSFHYPVNITVTIGVNNTIEWVNDDGVAHTVTSFLVPSGASTFNSDLIFQGKTFTVTLTVPGEYKYFCAWHNWLAGKIVVKSA
jgi:hypothetical protein